MVGDFDQRAPLAGFDIAKVVEQVDGLADSAGMTEEDMANGVAGVGQRGKVGR